MSQGMSSSYTLNRRLGMSQRQFGCFEGEKNLMSVLQIEPQFHIKKANKFSHPWLKSLYSNCVPVTCFSPPRAIFRDCNWYIWKARSAKWVTRCKIHFCEHHVYNMATQYIYRLLNQLKFTSGKSFCWPCCSSVSVIILKMAFGQLQHVRVM